MTDIADKLELLQCRMLVTELCRRAKHSRAWFYRVLRGETSCLVELALIDELLLGSAPASPIARLREQARPRVDQAQLARLAGVRRQTVSLWESEAAPSEERLARVRNLLRVNA